MTPATLHNWSVSEHPADAYTAPEHRGLYLTGIVYGHPRSDRFEDGKKITTGSICKVEGRVLTSKSGTVYRLGRIDPKFRAWLRSQGIAYNPEAPIQAKAVAP